MERRREAIAITAQSYNISVSALTPIRAQIEEPPHKPKPRYANPTEVALCSRYAAYKMFGEQPDKKGKRKSRSANTSQMMAMGSKEVLEKRIGDQYGEINVSFVDEELRIRATFDLLQELGDGNVQLVMINFVPYHVFKEITDNGPSGESSVVLAVNMELASRYYLTKDPKDRRKVTNGVACYVCMDGNENTRGQILEANLINAKPIQKIAREILVDWQGNQQHLIAQDFPQDAISQKVCDKCPFIKKCGGAFKKENREEMQQLPLSGLIFSPNGF